jgi:hypothetical protein
MKKRVGTYIGIDEAIDKLFEMEAGSHPDELVRYMKRLHESYREALQSMNPRTFTLLFAWVAGVALGSGLVSEAEFAGFKVVSIASLLPAFPLIIHSIGHLRICRDSRTHVIIG